MKRIYKFPFETNDMVDISMPEGATILCVETQGEQPCMWALVDPDAPELNRKFRVFGTGHPVYDAEMLKFIATYQLQGGALVFHIFEVQ